MCTVLLRFDPGDRWTLRLAAVRDEFVDRAWDGPAAHWGDRLVGGRDRLAGGTWLAVDPTGPAVAAVLNGVRRDRPDRRSRGDLPLRALRGVPLPGPAELDRYEGFHLVQATPAAVSVSTWDGAALTVRSLDPGDHVIVNAGVDQPDEPVVRYARPVLGRLSRPDPRPAAGTGAAWGDWVTLFGGELIVSREYAGRRYGSTSAALVGLSTTGVRYDFCSAPVTPQRWTPVLPTE